MKSLDVGTMFLVKGEMESLSDDPSFTIERNVFLQAASGEDTEDILKENNWSYAKYEDKYYLLGEEAIKIKNMLTIDSKDDDQGIVATKIGDLRRPMKDGLLNTAEEKLSVAIIQRLISGLIGKPSTPGEVLCFCVPGNPIDRSVKVIFHQTMLTSFMANLGYTVDCIPEALAIIFSEAPSAEDPDEPGSEAPFSGISFSFGAGMCNTCIAGNTIIPMLDGRSLTIKELSNLYPNGEHFWVYSCREDGEIVPGKASLPRLTKKNTEVYRIRLDNGTFFDCTPDHKIMMRDGSYKQAQYLEKNDSLMPLYEWCGTVGIRKSQYKQIKNNKSGKWVWLHRHIMKHVLRRNLKQTEIIHHKNFVGVNNSPDNLELFSSQQKHMELHNKLRESSIKRLLGKTYEDLYGKKRAKQIKERKRKSQLKQSCKDAMLKGSKNAGRVMKQQRSGKTFDEIFGKEKSAEIKKKQSLKKQGKIYEEIMKDKAKSQKRKEKQSELAYEQKLGDYERTQEIRDKVSKSLRGNIPWNKGLKGKSYTKHFKNGFKNQYADHNHKVVSVRKLSNHRDVYDLTVDKYHNFAIKTGKTGGIFVHNCFAWKKMPLINFSVARSGDWIDQQAAQTVGIGVSAITRYKEQHLDLNNIDYSDMRQASLDIFYQNMIEYALSNFAEKFNALDKQIDSPLEIVVAGGTASVPGFLEKFKTVLETQDLPFKVKSVRMAENPLYAVSNGCLAKALSIEKKRTKKDTDSG